jgi:hypothetical protein
MARRSDRVQVLARLKLMYQDARRSAELRAQRADALQRRIAALRGSYRGSDRSALLATLAEQTAHARLAEQAERNTEAMGQYVASTTRAHEQERASHRPEGEP